MTEPAPADVAPPIKTEAPSAPRRGGAAVIWLAGVVIVLLALVGASPYWAPRLAPLLPWAAHASQQQNELAARLAAIEQQLGALPALNERIAALEKRPIPDASAAIAPLSDKVGQLDARLDRIEERLAELAQRDASRLDSPQRVLMVALGELGNAVATSRPFSAQLASVEALGQGRDGWAAALQPLEAPAKTGIPSLAVLAQRFSDTAAPAILRAEAAPAPGERQSLGQAMLARLRSLVVIRRIDSSGTGTSATDRAVATAQAALDKGDLDGAAQALAALNGAPAEAAKAWLHDARQRLQAEAVIARLSQQLAGELAAGSGGGG